MTTLTVLRLYIIVIVDVTVVLPLYHPCTAASGRYGMVSSKEKESTVDLRVGRTRRRAIVECLSRQVAESD